MDRLQGSRWTPYVFAAPVALYLLLFQGWPLVQEVLLSFTSTSLLSPQIRVPVGFENYQDLASQGDFLAALGVTAIYTIACVVLAVGIGLLTALLLNAPFRGRGVARALVTIPWAAPPVAVALIFAWIYNAQYGVWGRLLRSFGIGAGTENWLDSPAYALPAVLMTTIWQIFPFASVVILAALQGVPAEQREAAAVDRADKLSIFWAVTWPVIRPSVTLLALFVTIWSLRRFDLIWLLTQGGPVGATNTLVVELYRRAFVFRELGAAAAIGVVGLLIALAITLVYVRAERRAA